MNLSVRKPNSDLFSDVTELPEIFNKSYFPSLDGLRAISIIVVIIAHVLMSFKTTYSFYYFANLGVQFFFVISGFLITTLLLKEKVLKGSVSLKNFYIRRFFRIVPVAYLYLFVIIIINVVLKLHLNWLYIITSFLFIRNFFLTASGVDHLSTHYWSLGIEEQFYLIFPVILKKSFRLYMYFLLGILSFSLLINFIDINTIQNSVIKFIIDFITQFQGIAIGSLFSILVFKGKLSFKGISAFMQIIIVALIILITMYAVAFENIGNFLKCILFGIILIANLHNDENLIFRFLNSRVMKLIGVLSFSMYIWQQPFTQGLTFINSSRLLKGFDNKLPADILITIISLGALGVISYISYNFYEKKFLELKKKFN